jgi:ribonuclease P protein component
MSWLPNSCGHPRLGFAIARKAVPSAAARNRIKRQLREQFRLQAGELEAVDVVFFAQKPATAANRQQLREAATPLWRRIQRCAPSSSS